METDLDLEQIVEFYKQWCYKKARPYTAPDPSKTDAALYKGKAVLCLRTERGQKLAMLQKTESGYSVVWANWFTDITIKSSKKKHTKT